MLNLIGRTEKLFVNDIISHTGELLNIVSNSRFLVLGGAGSIGQAVTKEIFKRMPNDTDFSVSLRANIPGIDFAFSGERNHYHTPNDSLENLDIRTIQHHGENILTTSKGLLSSDWSEMGNEYVFFWRALRFLVSMENK